MHGQLINSSWCGLLAALTPLIDAATDESITENVLKAMQSYAALCGTLGNIYKDEYTLFNKCLNINEFYSKINYLDIQTPRDAFITAICRSSLPSHYALSVLNMGYQFPGIISKRISNINETMSI